MFGKIVAITGALLGLMYLWGAQSASFNKDYLRGIFNVLMAMLYFGTAIVLALPWEEIIK